MLIPLYIFFYTTIEKGQQIDRHTKAAEWLVDFNKAICTYCVQMEEYYACEFSKFLVDSVLIPVWEFALWEMVDLHQ